jgi:MoaA/NifB/PqqE/SkfB family radical SAM enzyme
VLDLIAISLGGMPASHNRMRASGQAFEKMTSHLEAIRRSGIPFGFIFTLTQYNLQELDWVAQFALTQGARLLQIHPLEHAGRASKTLQGDRPDGIECTFAYLEAARVQAAVRDQLRIQLDLVNRNLLYANPERFIAGPQPDGAETRSLGEIVSPLVIEADGTVVPLQYGFERAYALGNLHVAPLRKLSAQWRQDRMRAFRELCRRVFEEVRQSSDMPFFNWYEALARSEYR